jgi:hypothetical protein
MLHAGVSLVCVHGGFGGVSGHVEPLFAQLCSTMLSITLLRLAWIVLYCRLLWRWMMFRVAAAVRDYRRLALCIADSAWS